MQHDQRPFVSPKIWKGLLFGSLFSALIFAVIAVLVVVIRG